MKRICARGLVVTDNGLAVIFRRKVKDGVINEYYAIPGGGINDGEDVIDGLKRELSEELDIEVEVNDLVFTVETDDRIEYYYTCKYIKGDFKLNGEELDRMSESNYYEPTFIDINKIDSYDVIDEVKNYFMR